MRPCGGAQCITEASRKLLSALIVYVEKVRHADHDHGADCDREWNDRRPFRRRLSLISFVDGESPRS